MTEGRTSAAEANVDADDRPIDATADDVAESAGTNGHETAGHEAAGQEAAGQEADGQEADGTTAGDAENGESAATASGSEEPDAGETIPAATLPGEDTKADDTKADDTKAEDTKAAEPASDGATSGDAATSGDDEWAEAEDKAYKKELRKGFAFGAAGGVILGAIVALLLGALVWPGYLLSPGNPDDTASQVVQALSSKDSPAIDNLSCKGPDGKPVSQLSGQVLQYITKVAPAGPATRLIDTEARAPVDLTLSVQGQTQTLPSELVLGESNGDWCLKGLAQRQ